MKKFKELKEGVSFESETEKIKDNKTKPENQKEHDFKAAHWTHKNGHPRCIRCGNEEPVGGVCHPTMNEEEFKVGDVVVPDKGPHAGQPHDVIHIHGNGKINVRPKGMHHSKNKYRLGAASADPSELRHHLDLKEEMQTGINRRVVQEAFKSAKEKKKVEKSKPKGEKIEVKGPGPDDKFQKDPIITPLTTSYTKG